MSKILFNNNSLEGLVSFRLDVAKSFLRDGHDVVFVAPKPSNNITLSKIPSQIKVIYSNICPSGKSIKSDLSYFSFLRRVFKEENPDIVLNYTIKPNIYGGLAAKLSHKRFYCMMPGLGRVFEGKGIVNRLVKALYCRVVGMACKVFVLNSRDKDFLIDNKIVKKSNLVWLEGGEGLDLDYYKPGQKDYSAAPVFVFVARLIKEKGYRLFVQMSKSIKPLFPEAKFLIYGECAFDDPDGVSEAELKDDVENSPIEYMGVTHDITKVLGSDGVILVIPSFYHEGLNRSLMEGAAMGCPIITTNQPGCKETVSESINGFLVEPNDQESLIATVDRYLKLSVDKKQSMSFASRKLSEEKFDVRKVIAIYNEIIFS